MTHRLRAFFIGLGAALAFALSGTAQASVLFSNFDAGNSYQTGSGLFIGDANFDGSANYAQASTFTVGANAQLGSISIALSDFGFGQSDAITVALMDSGANIPGGNVLESFTIAANTLGTLGGYNAPLTLTSLLHPLLTAGTQYWVAVSTTLSNLVVWNFSNTDFANYNVESQSLDGGTTWDAPFGNTRGAFQIDSFVGRIPEPATLALLSAGLLAFAGFRRRG